MLDFIVKYWLEFALGLIATGLGVACKKIYTLYQNEENRLKSKERETLLDDFQGVLKSCQLELVNDFTAREEQLQEADKEIRQELGRLDESMVVLKDGMLSLQGREFMSDCRKLLNPEHKITLDEYEEIIKEHQVYNSLGGNHRGDALFSAVAQKYENSLK